MPRFVPSAVSIVVSGVLLDGDEARPAQLQNVGIDYVDFRAGIVEKLAESIDALVAQAQAQLDAQDAAPAEAP